MRMCRKGRTLFLFIEVLLDFFKVSLFCFKSASFLPQKCLFHIAKVPLFIHPKVTSAPFERIAVCEENIFRYTHRLFLHNNRLYSKDVVKYF